MFCGNFLLGRGSYPPCRNVWCGTCYTEILDDPFPRREGMECQEEESDGELEEDKDKQRRYRHAQNGNHLMGALFECNLCSFHNICRRDPVWEHKK